MKYAYKACAFGLLLAEIRIGYINLADVWTVNLLLHWHMFKLITFCVSNHL